MSEITPMQLARDSGRIMRKPEVLLRVGHIAPDKRRSVDLTDQFNFRIVNYPERACGK